MRFSRDARRAVLLTLSLLSACAAADPTASIEPAPSTMGSGEYLAGRFALSHGDFDAAAGDLLRALAINPDDEELLLQAFIACLNAGRPEAVDLARRLPTNQVAQLLLADNAAKAGDWDLAVSRFRAVAPEWGDATAAADAAGMGIARRRGHRPGSGDAAASAGKPSLSADRRSCMPA